MRWRRARPGEAFVVAAHSDGCTTVQVCTLVQTWTMVRALVAGHSDVRYLPNSNVVQHIGMVTPQLRPNGSAAEIKLAAAEKAKCAEGAPEH